MLWTGALLLATGRDREEEPVNHTSTVTFEDAAQQAQDYAHSTVKTAVGKDAGLKDLMPGQNPVVTFCSEDSSPSAGTPVRQEFSYAVTGNDPARTGDYFARFQSSLEADHWTKQYGGTEAGHLVMAKDGFTFLIQFAAGNGLLSLTVETPCVMPRDPAHPLRTD